MDDELRVPFAQRSPRRGPGLGLREGAPQPRAELRIASDLGGCAARDSTADDVDGGDIGHVLERQRAQRLEPRHLRRVRRGGKRHLHDRARAVRARRDLQRLRHRPDHRQALAEPGGIVTRRDAHTLVGDLDHQALAVGAAADAHRPGLPPDVGVDDGVADRLRHREGHGMGHRVGRVHRPGEGGGTAPHLADGQRLGGQLPVNLRFGGCGHAHDARRRRPPRRAAPPRAMWCAPNAGRPDRAAA